MVEAPTSAHSRAKNTVHLYRTFARRCHGQHVIVKSEIEGRFAAAENLLGNPALPLTEAVDSPLYRVGAGLELNGVNGVGMSVRHNGAFGETVKQNAISASLKVSFQLARGGAGREGS
jgi:hypothetical protein